MANEKWYNSAMATYAGIGILAFAVLTGIGSCARGLGANSDSEETKQIRAKTETQAEYYKLQTELVKQGVVTNISQIKLSGLEK